MKLLLPNSDEVYRVGSPAREVGTPLKYAR